MRAVPGGRTACPDCVILISELVAADFTVVDGSCRPLSGAHRMCPQDALQAPVSA